VTAVKSIPIAMAEKKGYEVSDQAVASGTAITEGIENR
jgi:hypothetical protein